MSLISVVMPVYNCRHVIIKTINTVISKVEKITDNYEIIVVDDGSFDNTHMVAREYFEDNDRVNVISYYPNMGKGYAVKRGILASKGSKIVFLDGDMEIDAEAINRYIDALDEYDIVIASKYHQDSLIKTPISRRVLSMAFNSMIRALLNMDVSDTQAGLKAGRADVFKHIFKSVLVKRYAFDVEMLAIASLLNCKIKEMPVSINLDKRFKIREIIRMAVDIAGIAYRMRVIKWYQSNLEENEPRYKPILPI